MSILRILIKKIQKRTINFLKHDLKIHQEYNLFMMILKNYKKDL